MGERIALKAWYCDSTYRYTMTDALQPTPVSSATVRRPEGDPKSDRHRDYMLGHGSHLAARASWAVTSSGSTRGWSRRPAPSAGSWDATSPTARPATWT